MLLKFFALCHTFEKVANHVLRNKTPDCRAIPGQWGDLCEVTQSATNTEACFRESEDGIVSAQLDVDCGQSINPLISLRLWLHLQNTERTAPIQREARSTERTGSMGIWQKATWSFPSKPDPLLPGMSVSLNAGSGHLVRHGPPAPSITLF